MASTAAGEEGEPWRLAVLPLKNDQRMAGFLCIENPREHLEDAALAAMLVPHIAGEEKRFHPQGQEQEDSGEALLLSLPNLRSYTNAVCTLTSDAYSSMGAVCLDIPGLPSIRQPGLCVRQGGFAICFQGAGGPFREHPSFSLLGR